MRGTVRYGRSPFVNVERKETCDLKVKPSIERCLREMITASLYGRRLCALDSCELPSGKRRPLVSLKTTDHLKQTELAVWRHLAGPDGGKPTLARMDRQPRP